MVDEVGRKCPLVEDCGSRAIKGRDGENVVVLYILGPAEPEAVRAFIAIHLPPYAVPARVLHIDAIPRNANGKLVRKKLPASETGPAFVPDPEPEETAAKVLWIVRNAFENNAVTEADDFFRLGGHSLLAVQITAGIRNALCVQLKVRADVHHLETNDNESD